MIIVWKIFPGWNEMPWAILKLIVFYAALGIPALYIYAKGSKHVSRAPPSTQSTLNFQCVKNVQENRSNTTEEKKTISNLKFYDEWVITLSTVYPVRKIWLKKCLEIPK